MKIRINPVFDMETMQMVCHDGEYEWDGPVELARGEDKKTANIADTERTKADAYNAQQQQEQQAARAGLMTQYKDLYKNAATSPEVQATAASFGSAEDQLARRAAVTNNSAGVTEGQDQLARDKAQAMSDAIRKNQMSAISGEAGLYGMDTNLLARSLGIPVEYLNTRQKAMEPKRTGGFWESFGNAAGGALGTGLGAAVAV
ncbi:MAG: hypothetical protein NVS9B14_06670 [Candidatus Acidiferrum sp.]